MTVVIITVFVTLLSYQVWAGDSSHNWIRGRAITEFGEIPVEGVELDIKVGDLPQRTNITKTNSFGQFELNISEYLRDPTPQGQTITLDFHKRYFRDVTRIFRSEEINQLENLTISMPFDYSSFSQEDQEKLKSLRSDRGYTLFLMPYQFSAGPIGLDTKRMTELLAMAITTHQQAIGVNEQPDISILALDIEMAWTDVEKIRRIGAFLNALAVVGGRGEIHVEESRGTMVNVFSRFITIPSLMGYSPALNVEDTLPAEFLHTYSIYKKLNRLWLSNTILALSLRDFARAKSLGDRNGLERVRAFLGAERATFPPTEPGLEERTLNQIDNLLKQIDQELRQ